MAEFEALAQTIIDCDAGKADELTRKLVDEGVTPLDIINKGLIGGMNVVGDRFKKGEMYVPEVMMAAKAMHAGMNIVKPLLLEGETTTMGKIIVGTVSGDLHDIGKNLVAMMMESG
ncbi:MAG: B12-binding domain-containing protein, partial [Bacillota bacterium]